MKKANALALFTACALTMSMAAGALAAEAYVYEDDNLKIGEYVGLVYSATKDEVTDEDVRMEMEDTLTYYSDYEHRTDVAAADGDMVNIDYVGTVDGEEFDGGSDTDTLLTIGEGYYLEDFEKGIIGMMPGETKDVNVLFPEEYEEDLAGKEAVFAITLNFVCGDEIFPELTDESIGMYTDYASVAEFEEDTRKTLEADAESIYQYEIQDEIMAQLLEKCEVLDVPQDKIDQDVQETVEMYKSYAEMFGMEYEDFLMQMGGVESEEEFLAELEEEARAYEAQSIIMAKIAELENITLDDEAYEAYLVDLAEEYNYDSLEDLKTEIEETPGLEENLKARRIEELVLAWLVEHGTYVEPEVDEDEELYELDEEDVEELEDEELEDEELDDEELDDEELDEEEILMEDESLVGTAAPIEVNETEMDVEEADLSEAEVEDMEELTEAVTE